VLVCLPLFGCLLPICVCLLPLTQPHFTQTPASQLLVCSLYPTPRVHLCYPPTKSHFKPFSPLTPIITPTLHDHSRTNLVPWKIAINRTVRGVFAEWDTFGFLSSVWDDAVWAVLNIPPPGQQLRTRPDFPVPADLQANAGPAARDAFKRATDAKVAWLACSAAFCVAILDSIGESNCLAISDPETDTLHLCPRGIINAMAALHRALTGVEVDTLRLPLKKMLSALDDLPAHIVTFRGHLARLTTAGQAPLVFDAYRLLLASLSLFPVFHQYALLWTMANGAIAQQKFEVYAAYILMQHSNILAHSNLLPFAENLEGYENGASEDDGMGGDLIYPTPPPQSYFSPYRKRNATFLPTSLDLGFNPYPYPMAKGFILTLPTLLPLLLPLPAYPQTRKATDKKATRKPERQDTA
jgi:hypothetical protein